MYWPKNISKIETYPKYEKAQSQCPSGGHFCSRGILKSFFALDRFPAVLFITDGHSEGLPNERTATGISIFPIRSVPSICIHGIHFFRMISDLKSRHLTISVDSKMTIWKLKHDFLEEGFSQKWPDFIIGYLYSLFKKSYKNSKGATRGKRGEKFIKNNL